MLAPAGVDVDLIERLPALALPDPTDDVENYHEDEGEPDLEKVFDVPGFDGDVELLWVSFCVGCSEVESEGCCDWW